MAFAKVASALATFSLVACHPQPHPQETAVPPVERVGGSSVHVLPRDVPPNPPSTHVEILAAEPQPGNPLPEYPPEALRANPGNAWVMVRVVVSRNGGVVDIRDSPVMQSSPGPFAPAFRQSVDRALQQWQFAAATRREFEDGPDRDGDGQPDYLHMTRETSISMYFDLRLDFSIVEGRPRVQIK